MYCGPRLWNLGSHISSGVFLCPGGDPSCFEQASMSRCMFGVYLDLKTVNIYISASDFDVRSLSRVSTSVCTGTVDAMCGHTCVFGNSWCLPCASLIVCVCSLDFICVFRSQWRQPPVICAIAIAMCSDVDSTGIKYQFGSTPLTTWKRRCCISLSRKAVSLKGTKWHALWPSFNI